MTLDGYLADQRRRIDAALERALPPENRYPETIHRAMRYSLFAGGKRIRPILCIAAAETAAGEAAGVERFACALELVHTYSLIHDDLPALDDDDYRRGRPTCHKKFGEAMAVLAGDALLTLAFQVLSNTPADSECDAARRVRMISELAAAAGTLDGMIGGQVADIEAEGKRVDAAHLDYIHRSKTGALIAASVRIGAIYAGAAEEAFDALSRYGQRIGLAFQIVDDILDVVGSSEELGKTAGKDAARRKATYPSLYGLEASREKANEHLQAACEALEMFGSRPVRLREIAERIIQRRA